MTLDKTKKKTPIFFSLESLPFSSKILFSISSQVQRKCSYKFHSSSQKNWPTLKRVFWHITCSIIRENVGQNLFFTGKIAFFSKNCVFNNLLGPEKWSHEIHSKCQNTLWAFIKCFLIFFMLDNTGKIGQPIVFTGKVAFFSQKFVFSTT